MQYIKHLIGFIDYVLSKLTDLIFWPIEKALELYGKYIWEPMLRHHNIAYVILLTILFIGFAIRY